MVACLSDKEVAVVRFYHPVFKTLKVAITRSLSKVIYSRHLVCIREFKDKQNKFMVLIDFYKSFCYNIYVNKK